MTAPIITVTPTIMDGTVVRWFTSLHAAERVEPVLSASRERVMFHNFATEDTVPAEWLDAANQAHEALATQRYSYWQKTPKSVLALATHMHRLYGRIEPVGVAS